MGLEFVVFMDSCVNKPKNKKSRRDQSFNVFLFCSCVHQAFTGISTYIFVYDHVLLSILLKASFEMFCRESGSSTPPSKVRAPVEQVAFKLKLKTSCCLSSPKSIRYTKYIGMFPPGEEGWRRHQAGSLQRQAATLRRDFRTRSYFLSRPTS